MERWVQSDRKSYAKSNLILKAVVEHKIRVILILL